MSVIELGEGEAVSEPYSGEPEQVAPEDPPARSLDAMDRDVEANVSEDDVGQPVSSCPKPYVEIMLFDANDRPAAGAPYSLELPDGSKREGTLDGQGYARIVDVDLDPDDYTLQVSATDAKDGTSSYSVTLIRKQEEEQQEEQEEAEEEGELQYAAEFEEPFEGTGIGTVATE